MDSPVNSIVHQTAEVTLGGAPSDGANRVVLVYSDKINGVEAGVTNRKLRNDTLRVTLPGTISVDLNPGGEVHFVSVDGKEFTVGALVGRGAASFGSRGTHVVMDNVGAQLRVIPFGAK